jgi:segregation and condensation protein B
MARERSADTAKPDDAASPARLRPQDDAAGLSLDALGAALAGMLDKGHDPYSTPTPEASRGIETASVEPTDNEDRCEVTPRTIVEALLFVGSPDNKPLSAGEMASLMRGVRPAEIDAAVRDLNADYARRNCPYTICADGAGYRLRLRDSHDRLRDQFYGRTRQARLSQAAVEVLAIVAYRAPISADEISRLRGTPSGHILTQLVRRRLLRLERGDARPRRVVYHTTPRFLELFGLAGLEDLPRTGELEGT